MSEMSDRVRDAIAKALDPLIEPGRTTTLNELAAGCAVAAIEAMREPTEAVINALIASLGSDDDRSTVEKALDAWLAANAAMLAENAALVSPTMSEKQPD